MPRRNGPVIKSVKSVLRSEESMVGKICERGRFRAGGEREESESGELTK